MPKAEDQRPKTSENDVVAIVLAAGRSERMGAFKPLLPFGPTTVIKACLECFREGGVETVIVVLGQDARGAELKRHLQDSQVIFAVNPDPTSQMAASIACGVSAVPESAKAVLITPADHPAVPAPVVRKLIDEWQNGARLAIPTNSGRGGHPVLVDLAFREQLRQLDTGAGLRGFFEAQQAQVSHVAVDSSYIARDMDTWDDYCALHLEVFGMPPPN